MKKGVVTNKMFIFGMFSTRMLMTLFDWYSLYKVVEKAHNKFLNIYNNISEVLLWIGVSYQIGIVPCIIQNMCNVSIQELKMLTVLSTA